ncbi:MAG TPA: TonB-dependent receptor [Candidatus Polarisedimenticolaceae bacterium]|nr:TonB-dependent receptor [Candidatus Polarisedimenticolaceae bacterium]
MKGLFPALVLAAVVCASPLRAQSTSATLGGHVRSADGKPVGGALVQARSADSGAVRTSSTDTGGRYRFDALQPGTYALVARSPEGVLSDTKTIVLRLQQIGEVDLAIGKGLEEQVTVSAEAPILESKRTGGELRVLGTQAENLPVAQRNATDLALLDSSVRRAAPSSYYGERAAPFVINGQTGRSNSYLVDGLDNNDQASGTSLNAEFSSLVISEFLLLTHQFAPEFGRASGGVMNIITERGTNEESALGFLQGAPEMFAASGDLVDSLPATPGVSEASSSWSSGLRWGGPIKKDKAFWFAAFEHQQQDEVIPYTGFTHDRTVGGRYDAPNRDDNAFLRTDFNLDPNDTLMVRLSIDDRDTQGINVGGIATPQWGFSMAERDVQLGATLTSVISPKLISELRVLLGSSSLDQRANSTSTGVEHPSAQFGGNNLSRQQRDAATFQLVQNLTWVTGNHTTKFGYDVTPSRTKVAAQFNPNGNLTYDTDEKFDGGDCYLGDLSSGIVVSDIPFRCTGDTAQTCYVEDDQCPAMGKGHCAPDYNVPVPCPGIPGVDDNGDGRIDEPAKPWTYPKVFQLIEGQPKATLNNTAIALFAQDSWQATSRWLLDFGLRYDLDTFTLPASAIVKSTVPNGGAGRDYNNLAPRLGFTYTAGRDREWIFRGGAGVFYNKTILAFPAVAAVTSGTKIGLMFPQGFALELTEDFIARNGIDAIRPVLFFPDFLTLRFSTGTRLDSTQANLFNFGVERLIGREGSFSANVTRSLTYHVPLMRDLNPVIGTDLQGIPIHAYDTVNVGSIAAVTTEGRAWYTGLDLAWRWQSGWGWYSLSYTLSKSEDMGPDPLKGGIYLPPNSFDLSTERGLSDNDRRHRFVASGDIALGFGRMHLSGVYEYATHLPFNVTTGADDNVDGITSDRPPGVGRNTGPETSLAAINAYREAHGLTDVTSLSAPYLSQLDLRLYHIFPFASTKGTGQAYLQVYNVFNRFNGGLVEGRVLATNFGQPISNAGPPRTFELGLKMGF